MSKSKVDKYANVINSDAFLRASTINTRLSLLGRELNGNIENIVINEKTFGQVFNKQESKKKTIYYSGKYSINFNNLISDNISSDNILIEEKQKDILYKGEDEDNLKIIEEEPIKEPEKKENINLFDDIKEAIDEKNKDDKKENGQMGDLFDEILENKQKKNKNENNNINNNIENTYTDEKNEKNRERGFTIFKDLLGQESKEEIKEIEIQNFNEKNPNIQKQNNKDDNMNSIFEILSPEEEEKKKLAEKKSKFNNKKEDLEKNQEKEEDEEEIKKKDVLKKEYFPIDVIEEAEKYYNLSNESKEDLYPLNTYQMSHGLTINFVHACESNISNKTSAFSAIGLDDSENIYLCTEDGKIIQKTKDNKENKIDSNKYNEKITCIDIYKKIIITGDYSGNILIWIDNKINQVLINLNNKNEILCLKFIEVRESGKFYAIFSDIQGDIYFIKVKPNKIGDYKNIKILTKDIPVYNIILFSIEKSYVGTKKENAIIILATSQNIGIYKLKLKTKEISKLQIIEYIYGEKGKFQFDISLGQGFPPVADLKNKENIPAAARGSISNTISVSDDEEKNLMISISYGNVIQLFGLRISEEKGITSRIIGYYINERPVLRMTFIINSMIALITDNFNLKIINTYDFVPKVYNPQEDNKPTKNCFMSYELLDINKLNIKGQEIENLIENKIIKKYIYTNKIIPIKGGLLLIGNEMDKFYKLNILNYDEVLRDLCDKEDYFQMLWLSLLIFNKKANVLNKQLNFFETDYLQNKKAFCNSYLMIFFLKKVLPELEKKNEVYARVFLEFFMETDCFENLPDYIAILSQSKEQNLDKYIYTNLTKYMVNGNLIDIVLNPILLKGYIDYYINQKDKLLLNKVLLKLNLESLLQEKILKTILEYDLINPYIYTRIKNIKAGQTDYFLPLEYIDTVFKKDIYEEKLLLEKQNQDMQGLSPEERKVYEETINKKKEEKEKELIEKKNIEKDYKKLIIEHNMDYFNEKTFSCHEYIGHKFLWYCNKCICGKEYPNDTQMSPNNYKETAIKILAFLITEENIKLYLEFDSYTYLQIIKKYFFEPKLFNLINNDDSEKVKYSKSVKEVFIKYLDFQNPELFNYQYIFSALRNGIKDCVLNKFFIKYDFYLMICEICSKDSSLLFDKSLILEILLFLAEFYIEDLPKNDPYNCHRKLESKKEIRQYYKKIEEYMMNFLNYLKKRNCLEEEDVEQLLTKNKVKDYKKVYFVLCEESRNYRECFKLKIDEYERNPDNYSEKQKKEFFSWIERMYNYAHNYDINRLKEKNKEKKKGKEKNDNDNEIIEHEKEQQKFKRILLSYLKILCEISIDELSKITDNCFSEEEEQEDLIQHLGGGVSNALQLKYIEHYFLLKKKDMDENIEKYIKFLEIEIDLLIKERNKTRIQNLLVEYKILCNEHILHKLLSNNINDCCIYIYQNLGKVKEGVGLTVKEVNQRFKNILAILEKPNYNPILIDIELKKIYKYFELGLSVCQNNFFDQEKENRQIDENWKQLFDVACSFRVKFSPLYEINKNNIKTKDHKKIFVSLQENIQLILDKMSDYITLDLLVEIIAHNCNEGKIIEFYTFLDRSFYAFRRTETILNSGKNLMSTSVLIQYDELGRMKTVGKHIYLAEDKCDYCKKDLQNLFSYSFKLFECGHKYHLNCCAQEKGEIVCYVCTKEEIEDNEERAQNFFAGNVINELTEEEIKNYEKIEKKSDERKKKIMNKGRLNLLKKIRKKKREINAVLNGTIVYGMK